jgi:hypothetical protein
VVDRDRPPAQQLQPLGDQGLLDHPAGLLGVLGGAGQEGHGHPEPARGVPRCIGGPGGPGAVEQPLGQRQQDAGAVAGAGVGGDRAPVPEPFQPGQGGVEDGPAGPAVHLGHEADAAGVALVAAPVVQCPAAPAGSLLEVVRHLASESTAWGGRQDPGNGQRCPGTRKRRRLGRAPLLFEP